jgi:putative intracellular protease/amidase
MNVLCILPASDYDPTESSVPWAALTNAGIEVTFATPEGKPSPADPRLVDQGFGLLDAVLMTRTPDIETYRAMARSPSFSAPLAYGAVDPRRFDALLIPGGHAKGMRTLLESEEARVICASFFGDDKPVAAVCHGVLLPARSIDPATGKSVLHGRKTTCLTATMELGAWTITAPVLGRYYRTYPQTVEAEVTAALASPSDLSRGAPLGLRDSPTKLSRGFVVRDRNYVSARWPGDCHRLAASFLELVQERGRATAASIGNQPSAGARR